MTLEAIETDGFDPEHAVLVAYEIYFDGVAEGMSERVLDIAARVALGVSALVTHRVGQA